MSAEASSASAPSGVKEQSTKVKKLGEILIEQSLVSQDLDVLGVGDGGHALLLQPQGKLLVDFYAVHVEPDTWWCLCEGGFGEALAAYFAHVEGLSTIAIRIGWVVRLDQLTSEHRGNLQMVVTPADLCQLFDRHVAACRLLAQGLQNNIVEVAFEYAADFVRIGFARNSRAG